MKQNTVKVLIDEDIILEGISGSKYDSAQLLLLAEAGVITLVSTDEILSKVLQNFDGEDLKNVCDYLQKIVARSLSVLGEENLLEIAKQNDIDWVISKNIVDPNSDIPVSEPLKFLSSFPHVTCVSKVPEIKFSHKPQQWVITCTNQKGGVGKTTVVFNLAASLAERGARVLCLDLDPQGNLSTAFGVGVNESTPHMPEFLMGKNELNDVIQPTYIANVFIIPSSILLFNVETTLTTHRIIAMEKTLLSRLDKSPLNDFHFILIDTGPSTGALVLNALTASDLILIPLQPHTFALQGLHLLTNLIDDLKDKVNPKIGEWFILPSMLQSNRTEQNRIMEAVRNKFGSKILSIEIMHSSKIYESTGHNTPLLMYKGSARFADVFRQLANMVISYFLNKEGAQVACSIE